VAANLPRDRHPILMIILFPRQCPETPALIISLRA